MSAAGGEAPVAAARPEGRQEVAGQPLGRPEVAGQPPGRPEAAGGLSGGRVLRAASAVVALIGLGIATYLTIVHYTGAESVCAIAHGCEVVQRSDYSAVAGIPVAPLGLAAYLAILAGLVRDDEAARTATAFVALAGLGFSAWLTYVEIGVLHAICIWCVGSAVCMAVLAALSAVRMVRP